MNRSNWSQRQHGFTMLQVLITAAIIAIVTTFGFLGVVNARAATRRQNSARLFAVYAEKARADSIRRHAAPGNEASIQTFGEGTNTFTVTMDFDGSGNLQSRTFSLDPGIVFDTVAQTATFDWRGRIVNRLVYQIYSATLGNSIPVDISGSGDITIDSQVFADELIPDITLTTVSGDIAGDPTPVPSATPTPTPTPNPDPNATPTPTPVPTPEPTPTPCTNSGVHCRTPTPTPTPAATPTPTPGSDPTPTPTPMPPLCASSVSTNSLSLSQTIDSQRTGTVVFRLTNATGTHSISASTASSGSPLTISVSPSTLSGDGYAVVTITSKTGNGNRGTFTVNISASPTCGSTQNVTVSVGN